MAITMRAGVRTLLRRRWCNAEAKSCILGRGPTASTAYRFTHVHSMENDNEGAGQERGRARPVAQGMSHSRRSALTTCSSVSSALVSVAPISTSTTGTPGRSVPSRSLSVIGHEFVGEVVEVGSNANDFHAGDLVSGEGHLVLSALPQLHGWPASPLRAYAGHRRNRNGEVRPVHRARHVVRRVVLVDRGHLLADLGVNRGRVERQASHHDLHRSAWRNRRHGAAVVPPTTTRPGPAACEQRPEHDSCGGPATRRCSGRSGETPLAIGRARGLGPTHHATASGLSSRQHVDPTVPAGRAAASKHVGNSPVQAGVTSPTPSRMVGGAGPVDTTGAPRRGRRPRPRAPKGIESEHRQQNEHPSPVTLRGRRLRLPRAATEQDSLQPPGSPNRAREAQNPRKSLQAPT